MSKSLSEVRRGFIDAVIARYEAGEKWRFWINIILVVGGGVLAGLGSRLAAMAEPHRSWLTAIGLVMVFLGGTFVAIFDRQRTKLTTSARESLELAQAFIDERGLFDRRLEAAERLDLRRRHLLNAQAVMLEAVERIPLGTAIVTVIEAMLDAGTNDLEGAIGFEPGERWTFSIFRREKADRSEVMRRIAFAWADRSMEKRPARDWKKKQGFTGVSWQRDDEVIEADVRPAEIASQYPVPAAMKKADDDQRYVSVAVIPIRIGSTDEMWGSVTATSDRAGRWQRIGSDPREQNVQALRLLSQLIAGQVTLRTTVAAETL